MHVKICGITRTEDALLAADLGATAVGFVLWPGSPRAIDPFRARTIARNLPPLVSVVGVFVDQPIEYVKRVARLVPLDAVQLHGAESSDYCREAGVRVIKAVGAARTAIEGIRDLPRNVVVLLDACDPTQHGGTGRRVDWAVAARIARTRPAILAGGLCAENVGDAIRRVQPFGVDVSSGVEVRPGVKDPGRLREFFAALEDVQALRGTVVNIDSKHAERGPRDETVNDITSD